MLAFGQKVLHYRLLEQLGVGGMGVVYKAEDTKLRRLVALKFLSDDLAKHHQAAERFQREAQAASALNHPNICTIYDVEDFEGQPVIAMELLEGETLKQLMGGKPMKTDLLLDLAIQMADGLDAAHRKEIIHRDIKPANIFVTKGGVVKIVDFGVAKMQGYLTRAFTQAAGAAGSMDVQASTVAADYLTGPGHTVGTVAYMSPEQARGEDLDPRTDLFSLGSVLYEMTVGKPSAPGTTTANIFDAILNRPPARPRQLDSEVPVELERIIEKALEKDRSLRYQYASEIRTDLKRLRRETSSGSQQLPPAPVPLPKKRVPIVQEGPVSDSAIMVAVIKRHKRGMIAGLAGLLILLAACAWFLLRPHEAAPTDLTQISLTFNSGDSPVGSFALSSDSKSLAYSDPAGIHIKLVATGEERIVPRPAGAPANSFWEVAAWFPDSTRVLANLSSGFKGGPNSVWILPILSESPREIRNGAWAWDISPDGSQIAFSLPKVPGVDAHQIWIMDSQGENAQKVLEAGQHQRLSSVRWSPDGRRLGFIRRETARPSDLSSVQTCDLHGANCNTAVLPDPGHWYTDFCWLPGRVVYSRGDAPGTNGLWQAEVDTVSGRPLGPPRRITQWNAFIEALSASSDGKHIAFLKQARQGLIEWGPLTAGGAHISSTERLTNDETGGAPSAWTADSKQVLISLSHNGRSSIFKQGLNHEAAELVRTGSDSAFTPRLSPDGLDILYFESSKSGMNMKRIPVKGGAPQLVMPIAYPLNFQCPRSTGSCVIVEPNAEKGKFDFVAFDPVNGRGRILRTIEGDSAGQMPANDLSPDGSMVAVGRAADKETRIQLLSLTKGTDREVVVKNWTNLSAIDWAANGKGMYCGYVTPQARSLVYVDLTGNAQVVKQYGGAGTKYIWAIPSPDGKSLAILGDSVNANVWMLSGF